MFYCSYTVLKCHTWHFLERTQSVTLHTPTYFVRLLWLFILLCHLFMCQNFLEACKFLRYKTHLYLNFMFSILMQWKKIMYVTFLCQNFVAYKLHHCGLTMVMCQLNNAKTYIPLQVYLGQISCLYQHTRGDLLDISLLLQLLLPSFPLDVTASYHLHYTYNDTDKHSKAKVLDHWN